MTNRGIELNNYHLKTYAKYYVIAEMNAEILQVIQPSKMTPTEYTEPLWSNELCCTLVHNAYVLKEIF